MTKKDIISTVAEAAGLSKAQAEVAVMATLDTMYNGAMKDGSCHIWGHVFKRSERAARTGRNPRTGAVCNIPAKVLVTYRHDAAKQEKSQEKRAKCASFQKAVAKVAA